MLEVGDRFASLGERTVFSKVNLSDAYQQIEVDKQNQQYLTINMQKGLCTYKVPMVLHLGQKNISAVDLKYDKYGKNMCLVYK